MTRAAAKPCEACGAAFRGASARSRFCGLKCWGRFRSEHVTDPSWNYAHEQARKIKPPGPCERCGTTTAKTDVHHRDENWKNNEPLNLQRLCVSCHKLTHDRRKRCRVCGDPQHAKLLCNKHYIQSRTGGVL